MFYYGNHTINPFYYKIKLLFIVINLLFVSTASYAASEFEKKVSIACGTEPGLNFKWKANLSCIRVCKQAEKLGELSNFSRAGSGVCETILRSSEARKFGENSKACGKKSCIYKLTLQRKIGPGIQGNYTGSGVKLFLRDLRGGGAIVAKAKTSAGESVYIMDCAPSGCGEFRHQSGVDGKLTMLDSGAVLTIKR